MIYLDEEICIAESLDEDRYFVFRDGYAEVSFRVVNGRVKSDYFLSKKELQIITKLIKNKTLK